MYRQPAGPEPPLSGADRGAAGAIGPTRSRAGWSRPRPAAVAAAGRFGRLRSV